MTTRPRLATGVNWVSGLASLALFAVLAWTFATANLEAPMGFGEGSVVATIGYAMFDLLELIPAGHGETEGFLVAFILIAVVLDAALDGAVMLARREDDDGVVSVVTDGGRLLGRDDGGDAPDTDADREGGDR